MTPLHLQSVLDITPSSPGTSSSLPRLLIKRGDVTVEAIVQQRPDKRYHLVLRTGPDQYPPEIHATYLLPAETYFPDNNAPKLAHQDPYLAVLIHPHAMVLHQINTTAHPSIWTAGEGWTVSLPMETDGIWPGWFLQRVPAPPPMLQLPAHALSQATVAPVPNRWFSLEEVWQDALPIRLENNERGNHAAKVDREAESLIWVDLERRLALTFDSTHKQHTLWSMAEERHAPLTQPLYQQTRYGHPAVSDVSMLWGDLDEPSDDPSFHLTRQEALAQAMKIHPHTMGGSGGIHGSNTKSTQRPRPSLASATTAPLASDRTTQDVTLSPLIHPKWVWTPQTRRAAPAAATAVWCVHGNRLVLVVPQHNNSTETSPVVELQFWSLSNDEMSTTTSPDALVCRGAQPIDAVPGRTDLVVWTTDGQLVLHRSDDAVEPLLPFDLEEPLTNLSDAAGSRVTLSFQSGKVVRATLSLVSSVEWENRLWEILEGSTRLAWTIRLDCIRLQPILVAHNADAPPTAALQVLLEVLLELDWKRGQLSEPSSMEEPTDSWQLLLASDFHREFSSQWEDTLYLGEPIASSKPVTSSWMRRIYLDHHPLLVESWESSVHEGTLAGLFDSLHLLWEDAQLSTKRRPVELLDLLVRTVRTVLHADPSNAVAQAFMQQYMSYGGEMSANNPFPLDSALVSHTGFTRFTQCPNILQWLDDVLRGTESAQYYDSRDIHPSLSKTCSICRLYKMLVTNGGIPATDARVVEALVEEGIEESAALLEDFPTGVSYPLLDVLYRCRNNESLSLSSEGWSLVGRQDISKNLANLKIRAPDPPLPEPVAKSAHESHANENLGIDEEENPDFGDADNDGLVPLELRASMLFPKDNRVKEAARLLRSSRLIFVRVPRSVEVTDHQFEQQKQKKLSLLVHRSLSLPIGRGMMTIGGLHPVAAEPLPIPQLCLKGRVPPSNSTLSLDQSECPYESRIWPEFHNGVAAGLRLPLPDECTEAMSQVTRSWIVYNRPTSSSEDGNDDTNNRENELKNHSHGGFLLALGLRGHLTALEMTDLYEYLTEGTVTTTVGVLLGMAANKRGTCDMAISTMLFLHVPSLIPQHFSAIDVASAVQTAAVTGAGLLFQGSSHRMMSEFLLNEIGKRPESDMSAFDRESYTLACGLALGMVNLCVGNSDSAAGLSDLEVEARLRRYIEGGEANEDEQRRVRETNDRFSVPLSTNGSDNEKCSIVHEGDLINTDLTSPAATLALGLMYMKTGNQTVASFVDLPNTHFTLEWVRPDFLGLRVLAKSLILWDSVKPTKQWVTSQIPSVVQDAFSSMRSIAKKASEGYSAPQVYDFDRRSVRQMYVHALAGACFAVGVRFAGTGDVRAKKVLSEYVMELHQLREANDPVSIVSKPEFPILETCLAQAAIALALVMAGTGDLDALRLFKILRWRHDKDIKFGSHLMYGMAIGLLFLGGGTMTLGREPEHIAAIVTAFFPRFPTHAGDNQYHLQALRHLYALAVQPREVCAVDVDTGRSVHVSVELKSPESEEMSEIEYTKVPCLRTNNDSPKSVLRVCSREFYPLSVNLQELKGSAFFVKKRSSVGREILSKFVNTPWSEQIESSTTSKFFLTFTEYFDKAKLSDPFLHGHLLDSVAEDAEESLLLYMSLAQISKLNVSHSLLWDLRLVSSYVARQSCTKSLLSREAVALLLQRVERILADSALNNPVALLRASILYG